MTIREWPEAERPREKLMVRGAANLSDAELLAVVLRIGVMGKTAVGLARDLLQRFGSLHGVFHAPAEELTAVPGMGLAKYAQFQAVLELGQRLLMEQARERDALTSPGAVRDFLKLRLRARERETFVCVFLDTQHRAISVRDLFVGTLSQTSVYPREVVKQALRENAAAVIFAHNHPSGCAEPSAADRLLTQRLKEALALVDIRVLDHFVIGEGAVLSFAERGLL
jgi:DNA repair protein RadC